MDTPFHKTRSSGKKILVVDDEQEVLTHLGNILKRANYEVITTSKGTEAVQLAEQQTPDLIILDIVMPDLGGSEIASSLLGNPATANIPIIFLTGIINKEEDAFIGGNAGTYYVVAKPVTAEEILAVITKVLPE